MDFKNILQSLTSLSEGETKETGKGRVHKGSYGTEYDGDDEKKKDAPAVKRGRGRPKKDADASGEVKKYDTKGLHGVFGGGEKPKKDIGKTSKKHSLKEYIEEVADSKSQLDEGIIDWAKEKYHDYQTGRQWSKHAQAQRKGDAAGMQAAQDAANAHRDKLQVARLNRTGSTLAKNSNYGPGTDRANIAALKQKGMVPQNYGRVEEADQVTIAPAQQNTQVIKQGTKTLGTVTNPQLAQQIKQSIGKGEMSLVGDEMGEGLGDVAKKVGGAIKTGAKAVGKAIVGPDDAELLARLKKDAGVRNSQTGKPSMAISDVTREQANGASAQRKMGKDGDIYEVGAELTEKAPKGWEGTVKAMKKHKDDIDNPWALAHWMKNKGYKSHKKAEEMTESFKMADGTILTEGAMKDLVINLMTDLETGPRGYNITPAVELKDKAMAQRIIDKTLAHGERYKRLAGTLKSQLRDAALEDFGFTNYDQSLEEANTDPDFDMPLADPVVPEKPSIFAKAKPVVRKPMGMLSSLKKPEQSLNPFESKDMKDIQLEGWEQQLNSLLTEGITVTSSTGQQGAPDSVSINATDADAQELLAIVRQAGLGVFGGQEQPTSNYGAPMDPHGAEPSGYGTEPEASPDVVGDDSDMLALIKKMTGLSTDSEETSDYEDEEGEDTSLQPASDEEGEESHDEESGEESDDGEEETTEGNAFSGAVAKAKADGIQKGEKISVGGKQYPVKEDDVEEGNKFTGNLAKARAAGKEEADLDGDGDMEKVHEGEHTCEACGMHESKCGCEEQVDENFSNDAGGDAMADTELANLKALLAMGNDLHKMKSSNTVGNPTQVSVRESINEWKKLSGIK